MAGPHLQWSDTRLFEREFLFKLACRCVSVPAPGWELRREPIEKRKALLARLLRGSNSIVLNEHYQEDGAIVFREACKLGCEGIVSKRLGSPYRSGRSAHWVKAKNPKAPAVKREAEEDWDR
jgi:ATP-dependent DNA ligase